MGHSPVRAQVSVCGVCVCVVCLGGERRQSLNRQKVIRKSAYLEGKP